MAKKMSQYSGCIKPALFAETPRPVPTLSASEWRMYESAMYMRIAYLQVSDPYTCKFSGPYTISARKGSTYTILKLSVYNT